MQTRRWLKNYDSDVPHTLHPYPAKTLCDVVTDDATQRPDHPAVLFKGGRLSYAQLDRLSDVFAATLIRLGMDKGDRIALLMPNCPQFLICQLGAWKAGMVVSPLNPLYTDHELVHALTEIGARLAVVLTPFYQKIRALQPNTQLQSLVVTNIKEYLPWSARLLFTLFKEEKEGHRVKLQPGDDWLSDLMDQNADSPRPGVSVTPADPALLMFTGGTTGKPKAALSSHQALLISGYQLCAWMGSLREEWHDIMPLFMPLFHTYGNVGALSAAIVGHFTMVPIPNPRDLDDLVKTIHEMRPAYLCGVPTLFIGLLNHPDVQAGKVDFKSMKLCISGAAPLMAETKHRFEELTGGHLIEGYALTESVMAAVLTPVKGGGRPGAIGLPLPDVEIRIADPETGQESLPAGEVGEIVMGAPQLMMGYWQRPDATKEMLRDGWLYTGDLGYLDDDGYLYLVDRMKDVIKPSGFQVWPREVEEVIATHPAVDEVGVAGVPDERQGEAVKAWVVLSEGQQLGVDELRAYCREQLSGYKVPRFVTFCDELPKSAVGKVLRRELQELEQPEAAKG